MGSRRKSDKVRRMNTHLHDGFRVTLDEEAFEARWMAFHKQLFASTEYAFNDVCRHVLSPQPDMGQFDHSFICDDRGQLHLFYGTGDQRKQPEMHRCIRAGDWEGAAASTWRCVPAWAATSAL